MARWASPPPAPHSRPTESTLLCEISGDSEPGPGWPGEEEIVTNERRKGHPRECPIQKPGRGSQMLLGGLVRGRKKTGLSTDRTEGTGEADRSYFRGMVGKMLCGTDRGENMQKGKRGLTAHSRTFCFIRGQRDGLLPRSQLVWGKELNSREFI